jgi:hypothetical protein
MATLALFALEVAIAIWVHDAWIRPFVGDLLVVVLLYTAGRSLGLGRSWAEGCLALAYAVEILQAFQWVDRLGLGHSRLARIIMGTTFSWGDFLAYTCGYALVRFAEVHLKVTTPPANLPKLKE